VSLANAVQLVHVELLVLWALLAHEVKQLYLREKLLLPMTCLQKITKLTTPM
jgi:hypothetical protein